MTGQHRHPYSTDATVPATSPGRHRRPGVDPITQEQRHPGRHRGDVETIARARAERPTLPTRDRGPRCGECRLGLGVHTPADPLCDHHDKPAAPTLAEHAPVPSTLAPGGPLAGGVPAWLGPVRDPVPALAAALERILADSGVPVRRLERVCATAAARLVRTPEFVDAAQHVEVVVPLRTLEPPTPRVPSAFGPVLGGHVWGPTMPERRRLRVVEAGES